MKKIQYYVHSNGKIPVKDWMKSLVFLYEKESLGV